MARGFVYLNAVIDWATRKVLAWRLPITLENEPCLEALRETMAKHGTPEIMNTDQGSQGGFIAWRTHAPPLSPMLRIVCRGKGSGISQPVKANPGSGVTRAEIHLTRS